MTAPHLSDDQAAARSRLEQLLSEISKGVRAGNDVRSTLATAADIAHQLHIQLKTAGHEPRHHRYMIENRGCSPDDPQFYKHPHAIEDLLKYLHDASANRDPDDVTIGAKLRFKVYSARWDHSDEYAITRTADGWEVHHVSIGGPCDKKGSPFLFENLRHDLIEYPIGLGGWMEWLWDQAMEKGLSEAEVQQGLDDIATWVSRTERSKPSGGVWSGYSTVPGSGE